MSTTTTRHRSKTARDTASVRNPAVQDFARVIALIQELDIALDEALDADPGFLESLGTAGLPLGSILLRDLRHIRYTLTLTSVVDNCPHLVADAARQFRVVLARAG